MSSQKPKITDLKKQIEQLEEELKTEKYWHNLYSEELEKKERELEEVHSILDNVPFAPPRIDDSKNNDFSCIQRMSIWVSNFMVNIFKEKKIKME